MLNANPIDDATQDHLGQAVLLHATRMSVQDLPPFAFVCLGYANCFLRPDSGGQIPPRRGNRCVTPN